MTTLFRLALIALASLAFQHVQAADSLPSPLPAAAAEQKIAPYTPRFGRSRPVIAVVGENGSTVLSDYVIPYGVLSRSDVADVVSVATGEGVLKLPPLQIVPDRSIAGFDRAYPDGADYVIVPAIMKKDDPVIISWLKEQAGKGATMVSICNGSQVLANAGLTRGHRATGHWSTYKARLRDHPDTQWVKNVRYVADGKIVSSAGITAALPTSLALVEAIGGTARAAALAAQLGVDDWSPRHDSDVFHLTLGDGAAAVAGMVRHRQDIGLPLAAGVDEIALALTADAYSATMRSEVHTVAQSPSPVRSLSGLMIVPDQIAGDGKPLDFLAPAWAGVKSAQVADKVLDDITVRYGARAARFVWLEWEYPRPALQASQSPATDKSL